MKKTLLLLAVVVLFAPACNNNKPITAVHHFKNAVWERFEYLRFELPVKNTDMAYDIFAEMSFTSDFPAESLYVNIVMNFPSGEERIKDYNFTIKSRDGNFIGTKTDGIYHLSVPIRKGIRFNEAGTCKFEIENLMTKFYTPGLIDFGINFMPAQE